MTRVPLQSGSAAADILQEVVGYLNFSNGTSDAKFLANLNRLYQLAATDPDNASGRAHAVCDMITNRIDQMEVEGGAFADATQARAAIELLRDKLMPAYCEFHGDLLWHQSDRLLWGPFSLGRALEALLVQGGPWDETERIVGQALEQLNDYIGYRPVAVLESDQAMQPYAHEWLRPVPLYISGVGVAANCYEELIACTLKILRDTSPDLLREAWFDLQQLGELALDPRAYDFDHPVNKRPNYHFGQWDPHAIDNRGYYRRFVLQQIALDSLLARVDACDSAADAARAAPQFRSELNGSGEPTPDSIGSREEILFEAAAVLAGTILMASGTSGNGPGCHSSDVTLATLLPHIAEYRDRFYQQLLDRVGGDHARRLRTEAEHLHQPFGGARQHLNHELARRRAQQLQHVHLAQLFARMGYADAAWQQARTVRVASARMLSQIYCRLTAGHHAIDAHRLDEVGAAMKEIEDLLHRGIECGALIDPWNIVGFGGNFSLFPALENSVRDYRADDLIELVEQTLDLCSRSWTEAAARDEAGHEEQFSAMLGGLARWWDQYATTSVSDVKRLVGKEIEVSTNLVAGALNAWHKAGAAAGDIAFWRMFVDQFDSPKAFQLVVEALLDQGDLVASMALMMQWVSQSQYTPLENGDASFHPLALRWLRLVEAQSREAEGDQWRLVRKFFACLEANAEVYWHVPTLRLTRDADTPASGTDERPGESDRVDDLDRVGGSPEDDLGLDADLVDEDDELDNLFSAAYESVVYRDSTDDGIEGALQEEGGPQTQFELEEEARRLHHRLAFLSTVARLWKHVAIGWDTANSDRDGRRALLEEWHQLATHRYAALTVLLEQVHRLRIPTPTRSHESMLEFDRRRMIKDTILEQIVSTCVEMSDAGRLLRAASGTAASGPAGSAPTPIERTIEVLRAVLRRDADGLRQHWKPFAESLANQELLYIPLAKGGSPRRIVKARALSQLIRDLLEWLPRLGMIRETCELLDVAHAMEVEHRVGEGAVTEFDRLFASGYQAMVECLVASASTWKVSDKPLSASERVSATDRMLVESLQDLTELQLKRWLEHSRTLRLSVVEKLAPPEQWESFVAFIERYGSDLFTQQLLGNPGTLRAIIHQRVSVWLSNLEQQSDSEETRLVRELGTNIERQDAVRWLTLTIEAVVENYREYRDYNTTTTQSDHGEMLYTLIDFLRLRAAYDRVAWNLKPVVMAHEILVRRDHPAAAEMWRRALAERTAEAADLHQANFSRLCQQYGMRLATVAERLAERFTRPLLIDVVRALVEPAIAEAQLDGDRVPFDALESQIGHLASGPAGAGLDIPDWLSALEDEVTMVRTARRHHEPNDDLLKRIDQVQLSWEELQDQLTERGDD